MSLLAEERKRLIIELIKQQGKVKVNDLAKEFEVSTETIRRYLEELENENKLKKVYGGAVKVEQETAEPSMFEREVLRIDEKRQIAQKASSLIEDGDVIFVDEGSTTMQMVPFLMDVSNITIITNSFYFTAKLMGYENSGLFKGDIVFLGGRVRSRHYRASGSLTEKMAKEFYVDKAYISIDGIHPESGITSYDLEKCMLSKTFIKNADKSFVLVDHSKLGVKANYKIETLNQIDCILSDVSIPQEWGELEGRWVKC